MQKLFLCHWMFYVPENVLPALLVNLFAFETDVRSGDQETWELNKLGYKIIVLLKNEFLLCLIFCQSKLHKCIQTPTRWILYWDSVWLRNERGVGGWGCQSTDPANYQLEWCLRLFDQTFTELKSRTESELNHIDVLLHCLESF